MPRNIRSMHVQACQSADLAFNMPGVISQQNFDQTTRTGLACLGGRVTRYDLDGNLYVKLADTVTGNPERLKYSSSAIRQVLHGAATPPYLFALRNESVGAALDQAIEQRVAAFQDKYKYAAQLATIFSTHLPDIVNTLGLLNNNLDTRFAEANVKMNAEKLTGARLVKTVTKAPVMMMASSTINPTTLLNLDENAEILIKDKDTNDTLQRQLTRGYTASVPMQRNNAQKWEVPTDNEIVTQTTISESVAHPILDTAITHRQNKIAILKELIQNKSMEVKLPTMAQSMLAELAALDRGIKILQLNYAHTFLTAPLDGVITAIYKDIGETVEPGEPVLRVENDATVMLVGKIQWRNALWPGKQMSVQLRSVYEKEGNDITLNAKVLSVRGHSADNDEWDIVAESDNPMISGHRALPLNYQLDPQTDEVTFP